MTRPTINDSAWLTVHAVLQQLFYLLWLCFDILCILSLTVPGHGDMCFSQNRAGCVELLNTIQHRVKPKYHVFGHIHEGTGIGMDWLHTINKVQVVLIHECMGYMSRFHFLEACLLEAWRILKRNYIYIWSNTCKVSTGLVSYRTNCPSGVSSWINPTDLLSI